MPFRGNSGTAVRDRLCFGLGLGGFERSRVCLGAHGVLGFGLSLASVSVVPTTLPVAGLVHAFVALLEEPQLERRFGESLIRYKRSVNRWSPRWPPTRASP